MNARIPAHVVAAALRQRAADLDARASEYRDQATRAAQGAGPDSSYRSRTLAADAATRRSQDLAAAGLFLRSQADQAETEISPLGTAGLRPATGSPAVSDGVIATITIKQISDNPDEARIECFGDDVLGLVKGDRQPTSAAERMLLHLLRAGEMKCAQLRREPT